MKGEGARCSLAAVKGDMNSLFVYPLSLSRPFYFSFCIYSIYINFLSCFFRVEVERSFCGLSVATIPAESIFDPPPGRLRLLSFLTAFSGCERDHQ